MTILRPYQAKMIEDVTTEIRSGHRSVLLQGPTGMGKGVLFEELISRAVVKGKRVVFMSHRKELNDQISAKLDRRNINHGIFSKSSWRYRPELPVQVASVQTLARAESKPPADLFLIDEAHHVAAGQYTGVLKNYPKAILLGTSATPERLDGRGLGDTFTAMVCAPTMSELIDMGYLLPFRVYAPDVPDLRGVRRSHGDFNQGDLQNAIRNMPQRIGNVPFHYKDKANGMKAIAFCVTIDDSKAVAQRCCDDGIPAEHVDGKMPVGQRDAILERLRTGETMIVTNVQLWTEGVDVPVVNCVILLRPTESLGLYLQQVGRASRPYEGQDHAVILDHAGCVHRHGLPTKERQWSLEGRPRREKLSDGDDTLQTCEICGALRPMSQPVCPACRGRGQQVVMFTGMPIEVEGNLVEVTEDARQDNVKRCRKCGGSHLSSSRYSDLKIRWKCTSCNSTEYAVDTDAVRKATDARKFEEYLQLERIRVSKGRNPSWSAYLYKNVFGVFPPKEWRARVDGILGRKSQS